jgi:carbon monoxide dehydrogenase subunit G
LQLSHSFVVPVDRPTAWATFQDVGSVAECFPGAAVTSVEGESFEGTCKVKLGPIALQYAGSGTFVERDEGAGRLVLDAKGRDKRGNGTAGANVVATFTSVDAASTRIEVATALTITGKPAQFGRGVIQDVSDKLLGQFVGCLESRITAPAAAQADPIEESAATSVNGSATEVTRSAPSSAVNGAVPGQTRTAPPQDDALDLGATVLPILARTYWRQFAAGVLVLLVLRWLWRRRS